MVLIFDPEQYILQSSAYSMVLTGGSMYLLISLMAIRKRVTLIEDPCGSPFSVSKVEDKVCPAFTSKVLSVKKLLINLRMLPLKFHF